MKHLIRLRIASKFSPADAVQYTHAAWTVKIGTKTAIT
jgi:hypothetical protein